jgi:hypothetical protein
MPESKGLLAAPSRPATLGQVQVPQILPFSFPETVESAASTPSLLSSATTLVKYSGGLGLAWHLSLPLPISADAPADLGLSPHAVDGLLHLAMAAIGAFDHIAGSR